MSVFFSSKHGEKRDDKCPKINIYLIRDLQETKYHPYLNFNWTLNSNS